MRSVKAVKYISGFKLLLTFDDGKVKVADLERHLDGRIFEPLRDMDYFKAVRLDPELGTIAWDNGADFAPEFLYDIGQSEAKSA